MQAFVYGRPLPETGPLLAGGEKQGGELYRTGENGGTVNWNKIILNMFCLSYTLSPKRDSSFKSLTLP